MSDGASLPLLGVTSQLSLGRTKFSRLTVGGDAVLLLSDVGENVIVCALARVLCITFGSCAHAPWRAS
jgi:hypothetical protein